jgi:hypothetical protein
MEVSLFNVQIMCLREKIAAYTTLFDRKPLLLVSGTFRDKAGELVFLSHELYQTDPSDTFRRWLSICVDGEFVKLAPVDDVIAEVKLTV